VNERKIKALVVAGFSLIALLGLTVSRVPAPDGYEMSIYAALPWWFWYGLVVGYVVGAVVIVSSASADDRRTYLGLGVGIILSVNAFLILLPMMRGYFAFTGGDMLTHRGYVLDILRDGYVGVGNYYPALHVHSVIAMQVLGLDFFPVKDVLVAVYSLVYWTGLLILVGRLTDQSRAYHYATPFVLLPVINVYFGPSQGSYYLYPLFLFGLFGVWRSRRRYLAVVYVVISFVVFFHPMTTVIFVLTVGLVAVSRLVTSLLKGERPTLKRSIPVFALPFVTGILFSAWYFSFEKILSMAANIVLGLLATSGTSQLGGYSDALDNLPLGPIELLELVAYRRGTEIALAFLGVVAALYLAWRYWTRREVEWEHVFAALSFGTFSSIAAALLVNPVFLWWGRFSRFTNLYGIFLTVFGVFALAGGVRSRTRKSDRTLTVGCLVVVFLIVTVTVFGFYTSPLQRSTGKHVPESRVEGMGWFVEHRDDEELAYAYGSIYRYDHALWGVESNPRHFTGRRIPDHLGYREASTFGTPERAGDYLVVTDRVEQYYPKLHPNHPDQWLYTPAEFGRLSRDENLIQVYDNGGMQVYKVERGE